MEWTFSTASIQADGPYVVTVTLENGEPFEMTFPEVPHDILGAIQTVIDTEFGVVEFEGENGEIIIID